MPDRITDRLTAELDSVKPARPLAAQARYRAPVAARRLRLTGYALAGAIAGLVMAAATFATGSPNPEVWTVQVAGGLHRLQEPEGEPSHGPAAAPAETTPTKPLGIPGPSGTGSRGAPTSRPAGQSSPEARESPEPAESPESEGSRESHRGHPAASATPTLRPSEDAHDGGRHHEDPSPSPSLTPSPKSSRSEPGLPTSPR